MILKKIQEAAERYPDTIAVQMKTGDRYQQYTYRQLLPHIASVAQSLSGRGIRAGDRVALLSENRPEWMFAYLATVSLGAVIVPLDAQLTDKEVAVLLASSEARAVFVSSATIQKLPPNGSITVISFDAGSRIPFSEMVEAYPDAALPSAPVSGDLAALLYTSGTTGDPKGVMLSHGNLASNCVSCIKLDLVHHDDNMLCLLPLHHTYPAMAAMLLCFSTGATVTLLNSLKGPDILACMQETKISILLGVPQLFNGLRRAIFDAIQKKPAPVRVLVGLLLALNGLLRRTVGVNLGKTVFGKVHAMFGPAFRLFASGGARLDPDVFTDMTNLGFTVIEGYGLTETSPVATFNPLSKQKAGSIGIPVPDVAVRIANPDENGQGEIAIRGGNVMLGYYKRPQDTTEAIQDGWFYSGDLGYRDKDGYLFITGRSKEMIVLATGKKIFPDELEKFYKQIPSIKELCLLQGDHGLEAAVVPDFEYLRKMNLPNSRETIAFEIEDLAKDLPPYKRITGLKIFKDPLPVTRLGKLRRTKIQELYRTGGERAEKSVQELDAGLLQDSVGRKLLACLEPFSSKKNIVPDDNLELDLGLDSLARVELVVSIEKSFAITVPESFGSEVFTVRDVIQKIKDLLIEGPIAARKNVKMSWSEILALEPSADLTSSLIFDPGPVLNTVRYILKAALKLIFIVYGRLSVRGVENLPSQGAYILAPNHLSLADAPVVVSAVSWHVATRTFFLGTTDYFGGPLSSRIASEINVIPVDMEVRLYGAMQLSAYVLRHNKILCIFPEGGRSRDGNIKEFKKGVGIIAKELNIPVVPVAIKGTYAMLPSGKRFPRPARVCVTFGKPVYPDGENYDEIVKTVYERVVELLGQECS
ncbi:MAG TPA: AMP-binding protein [Nitrospirota bacterium]|nr:AMP-binding protein [Nitrospirota bacterium]